MTGRATSTGDGLIPGRPGPAIIAHAAGNTVHSTRDAIADVADFLEVDLFVHRGRFEARHERRMYPFPVLVEKWYLRWAPRSPFSLADLLRESAGEVRIFLDLKNGGSTAAELVREALDAVPGAAFVASSQHWAILRAVERACPGIDLFYSIDVQAKLDLMLSVAGRDLRPRGVSCNHHLLTPARISRLHEAGLQVVGWTVDDMDRARELIAWGVDGITTHRVREVRAMLETRT